jgi:hypothetical protein
MSCATARERGPFPNYEVWLDSIGRSDNAAAIARAANAVALGERRVAPVSVIEMLPVIRETKPRPQPGLFHCIRGRKSVRCA